MAFYEPRYQQDDGSLPTYMLDLLEMGEQKEIWMVIYDRLVIRGETELAEAFMQAMINTDVEKALRIEPYMQEALSNNVTTRVIEEGHIAYLAIDDFLTYPPPRDEERQIHNFYEEIRDFEHLIVDLRFNGGGAPNWFYRTIIEPNIGNSLTVEGFVFLSYGEYAAPYARTWFGADLGPVAGAPRTMDDGRRPIAEMLEAYDLPDLNLADMDRMDYGFRVQTTVRPRSHYPRYCSTPTFQGKIWLLTGSRAGSAAELSAWVARDTGFATLVGEVSGGIYGGQRTIIALPNSGIVFIMDLNYVTDRHGRPLEAGTIPHIFNHEGMNALETVLALIAAGEY